MEWNLGRTCRFRTSPGGGAEIEADIVEQNRPRRPAIETESDRANSRRIESRQPFREQRERNRVMRENVVVVLRRRVQALGDVVVLPDPRGERRTDRRDIPEREGRQPTVGEGQVDG